MAAAEKDLFRYLTGEITYEEWANLSKSKEQEGQEEEAGISLRELTVVTRNDGSTILTTGSDPSGQRAALKSASQAEGLPLVVASASSDGSSTAILHPTGHAPRLPPDVGYSVPSGSKPKETPGTSAQEELGQPHALASGSGEGTGEPEVVDLCDETGEQPQKVIVKEESPDMEVDEMDEEEVEQEEEAEEEEGEAVEGDDIIVIDPKTTMMYLTGEMPFEEYSKFLETHIKEEGASDAEADVPVDNVGLDMEVFTSESEDSTPQPDLEPTETPDAEKAQGAEPEKTKEVEKEKPAKKRPGKPASKLPRHLQGLMGEANLKFARGEQEEATKMCMEVIRLAPTASEPFQTLAMLYEENGDMNKALQFYLIAAHLSPSDAEQWERLAEMSLEQDNVPKAIYCYDKAVKYDKTNIQYLWARCDLHEKQGNKEKALEGYEEILLLIPDDQPDKYYELARDVTKAYHALEQPVKAINAMEESFKKHPDHVSAEDVNMLLELYLFRKNYRRPIEVLIQHCGLELNLPSGKVVRGNSSKRVKLHRDMEEPTEAVVPEEFPIDLRMKLVICLIHLRYLVCHHALVDLVFLESAEEVGDLYLDVAEAYMECGDYTEAKPFLHALTQSNKYNLAAVWLRYAECLNSLGELRAAARAYEQVVTLAPTHMEARVLLSALKQQLGEHEEALRVLETGNALASVLYFNARPIEPKPIPTSKAKLKSKRKTKTEPPTERPEGDEGEARPRIDLRLLLPRCNLLYSQGKTDDYIDCAIDVLFGYFRDIFKKSHLAVILGNRSIKHRIYALRCLIGPTLDQRIKDASSMLLDSTVNVDDLWELYMKLGQVLMEERRFSQLMELSIMALMNPLFMNDPQRATETDFICLTACLLNRTSHYAYNFIREICVKQLNNNRAWNLFTQVISMSQDIRHNRYCLRLIIKHPDHHALGILNGHNAMVAGSYKHALGEYVCAFRQDPTNPLIILCIGNTFIHMACQKFSTCRHSLIIQGCAFLNQYMDVRGECQESYYNMGRALHQLGLLSAAIYCYEKALECGPAIPEEPELFDLSREVAYNLALIYQSSNSYQLAASTLQRYLVI